MAQLIPNLPLNMAKIAQYVAGATINVGDSLYFEVGYLDGDKYAYPMPSSAPITINTSQTGTTISTATAPNYLHLTKASDTMFIIGVCNAGTLTVYAVDLSSGSPVIGTGLSGFTGSGNIADFRYIRINDTTGLFSWMKQAYSGSLYHTIMTLNGTTLSIGTVYSPPYTLTTGYQTSNLPLMIDNGTTFYNYYVQDMMGTPVYRNILGTISGTTITYGTPSTTTNGNLVADFFSPTFGYINSSYTIIPLTFTSSNLSITRGTASTDYRKYPSGAVQASTALVLDSSTLIIVTAENSTTSSQTDLSWTIRGVRMNGMNAPTLGTQITVKSYTSGNVVQSQGYVASITRINPCKFIVSCQDIQSGVRLYICTIDPVTLNITVQQTISDSSVTADGYCGASTQFFAKGSGFAYLYTNSSANPILKLGFAQKPDGIALSSGVSGNIIQAYGFI